MEAIQLIFLSPDDKRLRSGWRVLGQIIIWLTLTVMLSVPAVFVLALWPESFYTLNVALNAVTLVPSIWLGRRLLDRRSMVSLGLRLNRQAVQDVLVGIGLAGLQIGLIYLIQLQAGWLTPTGFGWEQEGWLKLTGSLVWWGFLFLLVGFYEELLSRGYHLQNLEEGLNLFWAVVISSGFFGLIHVANPEATWVSTLGISVSGLFFAFTYLRTRQLWLPIGIHIGWNFFEGPVFGFPVSGTSTTSILLQEVSGPEVWTGGSFGPEAGLVVLPGLALGFVLVGIYTIKRAEALRQETAS
jgi:membrane protease YdiL (CAAX protease family)